MEANPWSLFIVGVLVLTLLVWILIKNIKDMRDFYESMKASEDLALTSDKNSTKLD